MRYLYAQGLPSVVSELCPSCFSLMLRLICMCADLCCCGLSAKYRSVANFFSRSLVAAGAWHGPQEMLTRYTYLQSTSLGTLSAS